MFKIAKFVVLVAVLLIGGAFLALGPLNKVLELSGILGKFGNSTQTVEIHSTEIIEKMEREEKVVLLSLAIQGLEERITSNESFLGLFDIPGSGNSRFIKYEFDAKLGLEGKDVVIDEVTEKEFLVTIPEFVFIGHDDIKFELAAETKGALSWVAPESNDFDIANEILNSDSKLEYIKQYQDVLEDQAEAHYRQIVSSIDPSVKLEFAFAGDEEVVAE